MSLDMILAFIQHKKGVLSGNNDSLTEAATNAPSDSIVEEVNTKANDSVWDDVSKGPMAQLGKDFFAEQISKNGNLIIDNVDKAIGGGLKRTINDAQGMVFNTIAAALVAKNDLIMVLLQTLARTADTELEKKGVILALLKEKLRLLYNALVLLVAGNPFFSQYLSKLRQALKLIAGARSSVSGVRYTLNKTNKWSAGQMLNAKTALQAAEKMMSPQGKKPDVTYTDKGLLAGVGTPSQPQQLQILLAIPQLVKEALSAANGYFVAVLKCNALLFAFTTGYVSMQQSGSSKLKEYSLKTLDNLLTQLDALIASMATKLNGSSDAIYAPVPSNFNPDSVSTSSLALGWILQLKTIITYMDFVPGTALSASNVSNSALDKYNAAVAAIKKKNTRTNGQAVLTAIEGREEIAQLEVQLLKFSISCLQALMSNKASSGILALGRTLQYRLELTALQDGEIRVILKSFYGADLAFASSLKKAADDMFKLLDDMGLDRASDMLKQGNYSEFFNLNSKTATYAGAALVGLSFLKGKMETEEDREQLTQAEREIQREQTSSEISATRSASNGFQARKDANTKEELRLNSLESKVTAAGENLGLPSTLKPTNLLKTVGPALATTTGGGGTVGAELTKLGKGVVP